MKIGEARARDREHTTDSAFCSPMTSRRSPLGSNVSEDSVSTDSLVKVKRPDGPDFGGSGELMLALGENATREGQEENGGFQMRR